MKGHYRTDIPLYSPVVFHLVITPDIKGAHRTLGVKFKKSCAWSGGEVHTKRHDIYCILQEGCVTHDWIGHELYHAVDAVYEIVGIEAGTDLSEVGARIAGFLHDWVYKTLKRHGVRVSFIPHDLPEVPEEVDNAKVVV